MNDINVPGVAANGVGVLRLSRIVSWLESINSQIPCNNNFNLQDYNGYILYTMFQDSGLYYALKEGNIRQTNNITAAQPYQ